VLRADVSLNVTKARGLLANYAAVRALSPEETAALPLLCRGAALRFLLTRLYDWLTVPDGALVVKKDPAEYYKKLRFHRSVANARPTASTIDGKAARFDLDRRRLLGRSPPQLHAVVVSAPRAFSSFSMALVEPGDSAPAARPGECPSRRRPSRSETRGFSVNGRGRRPPRWRRCDGSGASVILGRILLHDERAVRHGQPVVQPG